MTGSLIKREYLEKGMHSGRIPSEDEGRDQGDDSINQRIPKTASKSPKVRQKTWIILFITLRKIQPY